MAVRKASATWTGDLKAGHGRFDSQSGAIGGSYSFGTRFADTPGTNPEELLAAAEAACFSMALSAGLEKAGATPERITTEADCTLEKIGDGFTITRIDLRTRVSASGIEDAALKEVAQKTKESCPVSRALAGVKIEVEATLE
jgi:osmotically inducible protein OsmC